MVEKFYPDDIGPEIALRTGLSNIERIDDRTAYGKNETGLTSSVTLSAHGNALEEDLAQLTPEKRYFDDATLKKLEKDAFVNTLLGIGNIANTAAVTRLFPGLDVVHPESYDYNNSRVKVFILSGNQYDFVNTAYSKSTSEENNAKESKTLGFAIAESIGGSYAFNDNRSVDLAEKSIIVVNEAAERLFRALETSDLTVEQLNRLLKIDIQRCISHEVLHSLGVAKSLPRPLAEGVVEWYCNDLNPDDAVDQLVASNFMPNVSYKYEVGVVSVLFNALVESGLSTDDIDKAFCSGQPESLDVIKAKLVERYGQQNTDRLFNWGFGRPKQAWNFIKDLEIKKQSNIGKFLEGYTHP